MEARFRTTALAFSARIRETAVMPDSSRCSNAVASAPSSAEIAALPELQRELLQKMQMEAAMLAAPEDTGLRHAYFDLLVQFAGSRTGLSHALLPELGHPLYFRCGSTDVF